MAAFWRYDWGRNSLRHLALAVMVGVWPWAMQVGQSGICDGQAWAPVAMAIGLSLGLAIPLLFVGNVIEIGRAGAPREFRHFVHILPVDRGEWALAKLVDALVWVGAVPLGLFVGAAFFAKHVFGIPFGFQPGFFEFLGIMLAGTVWTMLWAALLTHRWVLLGIPVFVLGEGLARGATSVEDAVAAVARTLLASALDIGLQAMLAVLLAVVFVLYHQRRSRVWAMAAACFALASIDGLRAFVWWWVRTRL